jgi:hypothetical protein
MKLMAPPPAMAPSINAYRQPISVAQEASLPSSHLEGMDAAPVPSTKFTRKRKLSPDYIDLSSPIRPSLAYGTKSSLNEPPSEGPLDDEHYTSEDLFTSLREKAKVTRRDIMSAIAATEGLEVRGDHDSAADMSCAPPICAPTRKLR